MAVVRLTSNCMLQPCQWCQEDMEVCRCLLQQMTWLDFSTASLKSRITFKTTSLQAVPQVRDHGVG